MAWRFVTYFVCFFTKHLKFHPWFYVSSSTKIDPSLPFVNIFALRLVPPFGWHNLRRDILPLILLEKIYLVISISCNTIKETSKPFNNLITYLAVSYPIIVSIMSSDGVCFIVLVKNIITTVKVGSYFCKRFHYNYLEVPTGRCSIKRAVLKNFATFTGKQSCWSLFLIKSRFNKGLEVCNFIKKGLQNRCFAVNIPKFLRISFWRTSANNFFWIFERVLNTPLSTKK